MTTPSAAPLSAPERRPRVSEPAGRRRIGGVLFALFSATMFASQSVASKLALNAGATPMTVAATRCLLAAVVLWILARAVMRFPLPDSRRILQLLGLGVVGFASEAILISEALARLPAGTVILIVYTYPAMLFVLAPALRTERADPARVLALVSSFAGVALVVGTLADDLTVVGVGLALATALSTAVLAFGSERLMAGVSLPVASAVVLTGAAAALLVAGVLTGDLDLAAGREAWGWMVLQGLVLLTAGIWAYVEAISRIGA